MKLLLALFALVEVTNSIAQENVYRKAWSGELLGLGLGISAQYDFMFKHSTQGFYDVRVGIGGAKYTARESYFSIPYAMTFNFGKSNHFFEMGVGGTLAKVYYEGVPPTVKERNFIGPMVGYRSISAKGFQFRIYANLFFYDRSVFPFGGLGIGKAFRKK